MSIARWGPESDVYLYENDKGVRWECHCPNGYHVMTHPRELWDHLTRLEQEGHKVPDYALQHIRILLRERGYYLILDYDHTTPQSKLLDGQGNYLAEGKPPVYLPFHKDDLLMNSKGIAFTVSFTEESINGNSLRLANRGSQAIDSNGTGNQASR
jgi:hypothetical protein